MNRLLSRTKYSVCAFSNWKAKTVTPLAVPLLLGLLSSAMQVFAAPFIFNTTTSVDAGQVIGIQGNGFGSSPQVWVDRIADSSDTPNPEIQIPTLLTQSDY